MEPHMSKSGVHVPDGFRVIDHLCQCQAILTRVSAFSKQSRAETTSYLELGLTGYDGPTRTGERRGYRAPQTPVPSNATDALVTLTLYLFICTLLDFQTEEVDRKNDS